MEAYRPEFEAWAALDGRATTPTTTRSPPGGRARCRRPTPRWSVPAGDAEVAAAAREALADHSGYLRDAALAFRPWDVDVTAVRCPTTLWYGGADERALPGADWFATRIPHARVVVRPGVTHWATLAAYWPEVLATLTRTP